jgi:hypothetical protein
MFEEGQLKEIYHVHQAAIQHQSPARITSLVINADKLLALIRQNYVIAIYGQMSAEHNTFIREHCIQKTPGEWTEFQQLMVARSEPYKGQFSRVPNAPYWEFLNKGLTIAHAQPDNIAMVPSAGVLITQKHLLIKRPSTRQVLMAKGPNPTKLTPIKLETAADLINQQPAAFFDLKQWEITFPINPTIPTSLQNPEIQCTHEYPYLIAAIRTNYGISPESPFHVQAPRLNAFDPFDL